MNTSKRDNGGNIPADPNWYSKGGYLPARPDPVRLKDGERLWKKEGRNLIEYEHQVDKFGENWRLVRLGALPPEDNYIENPEKRRPIVKVRRNDIPIGYVLTIKSWKWECDICTASQRSLTWHSTQQSATRHAHNHN